ncbi:gamma-glutamyl-gamma-aminobutyrate hydrolase family protein [Bradyrhizobium neotropicale]|uniref:gamma-glutamyl-gamma-aminobutyrate hydrolase family protein n=1 Tax=Bradyrhizobium neotropicale TaxID=1497615 RepID=UPI001AD618CE|nr:gamma-glutamyl-gamma-aminobutyrate hydrolase family protein [Bradyrhizobium neotropicale]MBO4227502.1 gamma-glutamyl-gamma-aminobutyrate hydrolase family protein [Bradyrhizobium neotropicale]
MISERAGSIQGVVGVTSNRLLVDGVHRDWLRRKYVQALVRYSGVACVILPTIDANDIEADSDLLIMRKLDGLVLTGDESNIDPAIVGSTAPCTLTSQQEVEVGVRDRPRDRLSAAAIERAIALRMPILGICRGLQELNVYLGGTLHPSLSEWNPESGEMHAEKGNLPRDRQYDVAHSVTICSDGVLSPIAGALEAQVNSLHNQGIAKLATALKAEAWASDGLVEAASIINAPTLQIGVQWHPEWHVSTDPLSKHIFRAFGEACAAYRRRNQRQDVL